MTTSTKNPPCHVSPGEPMRPVFKANGQYGSGAPRLWSHMVAACDTGPRRLGGRLSARDTNQVVHEA